jgi:hypothetical protein
MSRSPGKTMSRPTRLFSTNQSYTGQPAVNEESSAAIPQRDTRECANPRCRGLIPDSRRAGAIYCTKACNSTVARARDTARRRAILAEAGSEHGLDQKAALAGAEKAAALDRRQARLNGRTKPGPAPTIKDRAKGTSCSTGAKRGKSAEEARRLGWPEPAAEIHGLALYRCSPLRLLLTPAQCDFSRRVANRQVKPDKELGHPIAAEYRDTKVQLYADELEGRAMVCQGCPGVLGLACGRQYRGKWQPGEAVGTAAPRANTVLELAGVGGEW